MQLLIPGFGEEFGWRGFALQRLQQLMTPLRATAAIFFFHLLWHAPTYWLGQGMHNVPLVWAVVFLWPWTVLFTWVYNRSNGSILVSVFFHATSGASLSYAAFLPSERVVPITPELITMTWLPDGLMGPYLGVAALYWALAVYVLRGGFGGLGGFLGAIFTGGRTRPHHRHAHLGHHRSDIGKIHVDQSRAGNQLGDSLHCAAQHVIRLHEHLEHRGLLAQYRQQLVVRNGNQ